MVPLFTSGRMKSCAPTRGLLLYGLALYLFVLLSGHLRAQYVTTMTKLGDGPSGSVWSWAVSVGEMAATNAPYGVANLTGVYGALHIGGVGDGGPEYLQYSSTNQFVGSMSASGSFTVPVGASGYSFATGFTLNSGAWQYSWYDLPAGVAGTYTGEVAKKWYSIKFTNTSAVPVTYDVIKNGTVSVGTVTVPALTTDMLQQYELNEGDTFQPVGTLTDYVLQDGAWITVEDAITSFIPVDAAGAAYTSGWWTGSGPGTASATGQAPAAGGLAPVPGPANLIPVNTPSSLPTSVPTAGSSPVWTSPTSATADGERLDKATYRQGIDKLENKLGTVGALVGSKLDLLKTAVEAGTAAHDAAKAANPGAGVATAAGTTAKGEAESAVGAMPSGGDRAPSTSAPTWSLTMPAAMGGAVVNTNPFTADRFGPVCSWFRTAFAWLLGLLLAREVAQAFQQASGTMANAQQAKGNALFGGTGAQATALIAAGLMSAIILAGLGLAAVVLTQDHGLGTVASLFSANPYDGLPGGVAYALDQVFPLATIAAYVLARPVIPFAFAKLNIGVAAAVRFVVP